MDQRWQCCKCNKLLGVFRGDRLHLSFARGPEYLVGFPVTCSCPRCGALNECRQAAGRPLFSPGK